MHYTFNSILIIKYFDQIVAGFTESTGIKPGRQQMAGGQAILRKLLKLQFRMMPQDGLDVPFCLPAPGIETIQSFEYQVACQRLYFTQRNPFQ